MWLNNQILLTKNELMINIKLVLIKTFRRVSGGEKATFFPLENTNQERFRS